MKAHNDRPEGQRTTLFVACAPGLEPLLVTELGALTGLPPDDLSQQPGGVTLHVTQAHLHALLLRSSLALTVRAELARFRVTKLAELHRKVARLPWSRWLGPANHWTIKAVCKRSRLYHSGAVAQRVDAGIADVVRRSEDESAPPLEVLARIVRDECVLSLDLCGEALHRRGWRQQTAKAPLREDLARALLIVSGWDREGLLVDPFMGAGTIVLEAAQWAAGMAPGGMRRFALHRTALHDPRAWARAHQQYCEKPGRSDLSQLPVLGRDRLEGALRAAQGNAVRAELAGRVELSVADLTDVPLPPQTRFVVTNPPWGQRLRGGGGSLQALGRRIVEVPGPVDVTLLLPASARLHRLPGTDIALRPALMTDHGGTKVVLLTGAKPAIMR